MNKGCEELDIRRRICPRGKLSEEIRLVNKLTQAHEVVVENRIPP